MGTVDRALLRSSGRAFPGGGKESRHAHDMSAVKKEDLAEMAALLSLIDEYLGVSNTNMHVPAGVQTPAAWWSPFSPDFRCMHLGDEAPWFGSLTALAAAHWATAIRLCTSLLLT